MPHPLPLPSPPLFPLLSLPPELLLLTSTFLTPAETVLLRLTHPIFTTLLPAPSFTDLFSISWSAYNTHRYLTCPTCLALHPETNFGLGTGTRLDNEEEPNCCCNTCKTWCTYTRTSTQYGPALGGEEEKLFRAREEEVERLRELRKRQRLDFEVWGEVRDPRDPYFGWRAQILVEERRRRKWRMAKALCGVKNGREECGVAVCRCCGKGVEGGLNALQRVGLPLLDGEESEGLSDEEVLRRTREGEASLEVRRWMLESVIG